MKILKRESPLTLARETLWRAQREWNRKRTPARLQSIGEFQFRRVPYYAPAPQSLSKRAQTLILSFADEICAGRYPLLSYETPGLGLRPRWNRDFVSGAEWPCVPCDFRECLRQDGSDIKVPYELSRLQFLPVLGKGFVVSGDASYRRAAMALLSHWIEANPVLQGVNWTLAMEAALRGMSICFLLNLLAPFSADEQPWLKSATRSLAEHLLFIEGHNEFSHLVSSNHYLSNIVGGYCLSVFLEGDGMAARRRRYRRKIGAEMAKQVYEDGADYEASTGYHVLVTQLFTTAFLLMRAEGRSAIPPAFGERLRLMFRFLGMGANSWGELPHVGDCDDGRTEFLLDDLHQMLLVPLAERNSLRVSHLLGIGQRLFGEGRGSSDDAAWYGLTDTEAGPVRESRADSQRDSSVSIFPRGGIGILRNGSAELLFFAIPNGIHGKGSHTHNDKLSFVLRIAGREVLCDPGTGCYTRDMAMRNHFRGTAAHNTISIDRVEQNRIPVGLRGLFLLGNEASVSQIEEGKNGNGHFLRASHSGYRVLGVTHTRTVWVADDEAMFVIEDELEGAGEHEFEFNLQLAPECRPELSIEDRGIAFRIHGASQNVRMLVSAPTAALLHASIEASPVSRAFGVTVPAEKLRIRGRASLPARIITRLSWSAKEEASTTIDLSEEVPAREAIEEGIHHS